MLAALQREQMCPEELMKKRILAINSHQTAATPYSEPCENSGCENTGYWSQTRYAHLRCISTLVSSHI